MNFMGEPIRPIDLRAASDEDYALLWALENRLRAERLPNDPPIPMVFDVRYVDPIGASV
jgi:hypothetical protein